ncbi:MAG: SM-20-related protein [Parvicella sp.]|jgi:SM-20-related protein
MQDQESQEHIQFEQLIQGLINDQYGCCDHFIPQETAEGLRQNMALHNATGNLKQAGIGNKFNLQKDTTIRNDKVAWIEVDSVVPFEDIYLQKIWRFINYLNKTCFTSIITFESHYAKFEKGSFYKKHIDQFKSEKGRKFSIVLYLNQDWLTADEGMLSLYPKEGKQINIAPIEGRMVFFRSDEMEHEVHPSPTRDRRSIAGWLKN